MTRIDGVPASKAGPNVKLIYSFTRRSLAQLTGREPEGTIEPVQMYDQQTIGLTSRSAAIQLCALQGWRRRAPSETPSRNPETRGDQQWPQR